MFFSSLWRNFQNRRLGPRSQALGHQEEPASNELWQTEPLHTPVLQERHYSKARRVTQAGVPVRQPCMMMWGRAEEDTNICWTYCTVTQTLNCSLYLMFNFNCKDCLLNYALLPMTTPFYFIVLKTVVFCLWNTYRVMFGFRKGNTLLLLIFKTFQIDRKYTYFCFFVFVKIRKLLPNQWCLESSAGNRCGAPLVPVFVRLS